MNICGWAFVSSTILEFISLIPSADVKKRRRKGKPGIHFLIIFTSH